MAAPFEYPHITLNTKEQSIVMPQAAVIWFIMSIVMPLVIVMLSCQDYAIIFYGHPLVEGWEVCSSKLNVNGFVPEKAVQSLKKKIGFFILANYPQTKKYVNRDQNKKNE